MEPSFGWQSRSPLVLITGTSMALQLESTLLHAINLGSFVIRVECFQTLITQILFSGTQTSPIWVKHVGSKPVGSDLHLVQSHDASHLIEHVQTFSFDTMHRFAQDNLQSVRLEWSSRSLANKPRHYSHSQRISQWLNRMLCKPEPN
ncbi:Hypothetical_protein [Hexamita inflata]|uniref:Hypothetical_protein n=1 Tax=Hexamita inflata TaxID=28002 RepID=A0AA86V637_9EUKA|nr:Hypothetical protein HINF_LOCUS65566 [Hexamita inflata]